MAAILGAATVNLLRTSLVCLCLILNAVVAWVTSDRVDQLARLTSAMIADMNYLDSRIEAVTRKPACFCEAEKGVANRE